MKKFLTVLLALWIGIVQTRIANAQWQVPADTIPIGKGPGVIGFSSFNPSTGACPVRAGTTLTILVCRSSLTASTNFYVNGGIGVDSATCGLAVGAAACKTLQYMANRIYSNIDLAGFCAVVNIANGTYASVQFLNPWVGGTCVYFIGASQAGVIIDGAGGLSCVLASNFATITVQTMTVQNCTLELTAPNGYSELYFSNITFNAPTAGGIGVYCSRQAYCEVVGFGNIINAVGTSFIEASHQGNFRAGIGGTPFTIGANITLSTGCFVYASSLGDITFTNFVASAFDLNGHTVTGCRWRVDSGGLIQTIEPSGTFFPGSSPGLLIGMGSFNAPFHTAPTIFSGGGAGPTITGTDYDGIVTEGAGSTGVVILFTWPFNRPPICTVSYQTVVTSLVFLNNEVTLGTTHNAAATSFTYHCSGG